MNNPLFPEKVLVDKSNQSPSSGLLEILWNQFLPGDLRGNNPNRLILAASSRYISVHFGDDVYHSRVKDTFRENDPTCISNESKPRQEAGKHTCNCRLVVLFRFSDITDF